MDALIQHVMAISCLAFNKKFRQKKYMCFKVRHVFSKVGLELSKFKWFFLADRNYANNSQYFKLIAVGKKCYIII